jgi:succinoglycan biosynthesis protein ExoM
MSWSVNVMVATYQRPERLRKALDSLRVSAEQAPSDLRIGVTVVDDDESRSAEQVVLEFGTAFADGCSYVVSGARNISTARNTGLAAASERAAWVGSIDDDVVVPPRWFEVCLDLLRDGRFDAVTGPLVKDFSLGPQWLSSEPFGRIGLLAGVDGEPAEVCATGNNWISSDFLRRFPSIRFDEALGRTGGEDMDFFYRAVEVGLRPVYSLEAAVVEREPVARCTMRYQLRRAFWLGVSEGQISMRRGKASRKRLLARAARRAVERGARQLPPEDRAASGVRHQSAVLAQCLGLVLGCFGLTLSHA